VRVSGVLPLLLVILTLANTCLALELSTPVFTSEDEAYEALRLGEIDYYQYVRLREIAVNGIDSTLLFLYDEIPNLSFFCAGRRPLETALETEQKKPFARQPEYKWPKGEFSYRYSKKLKEDSQTRYRTLARIRFSDCLSGSFRIHREYAGPERFVGRTITYRNPKGLFRRVTMGSFSQRLGLGTIFGYRGKLLDRSGKLSSESFLFPDYGGFNGLLVTARTNLFNITGIGSFTRDENHAITTVGGMMQKREGRIRPGLLVGINRVKRRGYDSVLVARKLGLYLLSRYNNGYSSLEVSGQAGDPGTAGAVVIEGRHRLEKAEVRYAGWVYSDEYLDFSSGSKAGNVRHDMEIEEINLGYSTKRSGQEGGLIRTVVELCHGLRLNNSLLHARYNRDTMNTQFSSALVRRFSRALSVQIDYLGTVKERAGASTGKDEVQQRSRLEARFTGDRFSLRSYIAYSTSTERSDYVSLFAVLRLSRPELGRLELWSNLARLDSDGVEYWYMYIRNERQLLDGVWVAVKLGYTYYQGEADRYHPVLSLELRTQL